MAASFAGRKVLVFRQKLIKTSQQLATIRPPATAAD
jgi:hypothetical protein